MAEVTDDEYEAYGAMIHAMKPRDYPREIADERDRLREQLNVLQGSISAYHTGELERQVATLRAEVERLTQELAETEQDYQEALDQWDDSNKKLYAAKHQVATLREALECARNTLAAYHGTDGAIEKIDAILAETEKKNG